MTATMVGIPILPRRLLDSVRDALRESKEPMRHLEIVESRYEWRGKITDALNMLQERGEVVSFEGHDGYTRYAMKAR